MAMAGVVIVEASADSLAEPESFGTPFRCGSGAVFCGKMGGLSSISTESETQSPFSCLRREVTKTACRT